MKIIQSWHPTFEYRYTVIKYTLYSGDEMRGGRRVGAGRKKKPDHLRRELVTIRLPKWMISQLKNNGEIGYLIENNLAKKYFLDLPVDYEVGS